MVMLTDLNVYLNPDHLNSSMYSPHLTFCGLSYAGYPLKDFVSFFVDNRALHATIL